MAQMKRATCPHCGTELSDSATRAMRQASPMAGRWVGRCPTCEVLLRADRRAYLPLICGTAVLLIEIAHRQFHLGAGSRAAQIAVIAIAAGLRLAESIRPRLKIVDERL